MTIPALSLQHDYPTQCKPGGAQGNYLMYASATTGSKHNNRKFSVCSVRNVSATLRELFSEDNFKPNCLQGNVHTFLPIFFGDPASSARNEDISPQNVLSQLAVFNVFEYLLSSLPGSLTLTLVTFLTRGAVNMRRRDCGTNALHQILRLRIATALTPRVKIPALVFPLPKRPSQ